MATSPISLLYQPFQAIIDSIVLDASLKEEHTGEVEVTDHPVEQGAAVTDHARPKPEELTIEGVVSNTPLNALQTSRAVTYEGVPFTTSAASNAVRGKPGNAESAYTQLLDLKEGKRLLTIVTALRTYENMLMTSLKVPRDAQTGDVLKFEAKFKSIRIVTNAVTVVATQKPKAKKPVAKGSQPTSTPAASKITYGPKFESAVSQASANREAAAGQSLPAL